MGCATNTASSNRPSKTAGNRNNPIIGCAIQIPGRWLGLRRIEVPLNCSFEVRGGSLQPVPGRPSKLIGVPYDRPVVGFWRQDYQYPPALGRHYRPTSSISPQFSHGDFVSAVAETLAAESLTRVLYPDDSTSFGQGLRFIQEYFLVACSLGDLVRRFRQTNDDWNQLPEKVAIQLNDTHPSMAVPELMRILLDEVHLGWDQAWALTRQVLAYTNHTLLPEALRNGQSNGFRTCCRGTWRLFSRSTGGSWMTFGRATLGTKRGWQTSA